ncbi:MAG: tyrosine-type recombinase/integrase [Candidatus Paceibacterota bacterium]|jgi:integrase
MIIDEYKIGSLKYYKARFWYYKNGTKKSKSKQGFIKKKVAETWAINEKRRLEGLEIGADKTKVKDFLDRWIGIKENKLSPTTLSGYRVNIKHIKDYIGNEILSKLKLIDIQEMADGLTGKGLKFMTVSYVIRTLHAAFGYAIKNNLMPNNTCSGVEIREDEEKFEVCIYTADDLSRLILALREQEHYIYPAVLLGSMRGLRRGECLGLPWSEIDFDNGIAHIKNNYIVVGKQEYHKKVKTKESDRKIDISGFIADEFKSIKERNEKSGIIQTYVCEVDGALPDPTHISRALKSFQKANGFPICRFHDLRHTYAMLQVECKTDLETLKRLLGHSKLSVTERYLHENMNLKKAASVKLDNILKFECDKSETNSKI